MPVEAGEDLSSVQRGIARTPCAIGDYAIIGDCRSAALISKAGSIDWLCWPCFDSPSMFGALLDDEQGGRWQICPTAHFQSKRRYVGQTNVLETVFTTATGVVKLVDFMPVEADEWKRENLSPDQEIRRIVECVSGEVEMKLGFNPRPEFGKAKVEFKDKGKLGLRVRVGRAVTMLFSERQLELSTQGAGTTFRLANGDVAPFSLTYSAESPSVLPRLESSADVLKATLAWWEKWASQCTYQGEYKAHVVRSALTLKLLEFAPSGAFVAAATTSLPERIGSDMNWDYRYCWLRDASLTIGALCGAGFQAEAEAFAEWMMHATKLTQPKLMVMYDVYGNLVKPEKKLEQWAGYAGSRPVNVGNQARKQFQLDTYGEVICGAAQVVRSRGKVDRETSKVLAGFGEYVCKNWSKPDDGIWEPRGGKKPHTHSRLMCWIAVRELLDLAEKGFIKINKESFERVRDEIRHELETHSWDEAFGSYVSEPGETGLDATLLMLALHKFEEPSSERMMRTHRKVIEGLGGGGPLLYRNHEPSVEGEGAFVICSFWAIEFLAEGGGSLAEAKEKLKAMIRYANDVGLFAEEIDPNTGAALGNFPQAFSHVGFINAVLAIEARERKERGEAKPREECA